MRYEIDGQRYSYSTNNIQQVKEARQRIEAANAAAAAKARAEAERAANPFARIFGSQAQREAAEAQARLSQSATTGTEADVASTSSVGSSRAQGRALSGTRTKTRIARRLALQEARLERRRKLKTDRAQVVAARSLARPDARAEGETPPAPRSQIKPIPASTSPAIETPQTARAPSTSSPGEPARKESGGDSLADFVNQVRKAPLGDAPRL